MQKTFKKAIACLLAVLMLICSVPFTATAAGPRQWWIEDGVDTATVVAEPEYQGYNSTLNGYVPWEWAFGSFVKSDTVGGEAEDTRNLVKPIIAMTVSEIGKNGDDPGTVLKNVYNQYYGNGTLSYETVKTDGRILNPTTLKAGQRIAVAFEVGGFDTLYTGQLKFTVNTNKIVPSCYTGAPSKKGGDKWAKGTTTFTWNTDASVVYGSNYFQPGTTSANAETGAMYIPMNGKYMTSGLSTFLGTGLNDSFGARPYGKYGIVFGVAEFEVIEDCDLTQELSFVDRNPSLSEGGTSFATFAPSDFSDGKNLVGFGVSDDMFANMLPIWPDAVGAATREFDVTVAPFSNGTVTMDGETVDPATGATKKIAENNVVTLTATPAANAQFVGWKANDGTTVSTEPSITAVVNANITYTPYFVVNDASTFVVKFVDAFENIVSVQTVTNGSEVIVPAVPARAGYTANGWSVTDFTTLTEDTVVTPKYTKEVTEYTVTVPAGSTITVNGVDQEGTTAQVPYNTQVTVYNPSATAWEINGTTVAYGNTYTFYVGADVDLTIKESVISEQVPCVGSVNTTVSPDGSRVSFLATRKIQTAAGCVQVNAGFIYGTTGVTASTELVDVNGTSVKAVYTKTDSEQYSISFTVTPGSGKTYNGKAFITYKNQTTGEINVAYANLQTYNA